MTTLEDKAARFWREFVRIDRCDLTSLVRSGCAVVDSSHPLCVRSWGCGGVRDRPGPGENVAKAAWWVEKGAERLGGDAHLAGLS